MDQEREKQIKITGTYLRNTQFLLSDWSSVWIEGILSD